MSRDEAPRVLIDTNVLLSFLLGPSGTGSAVERVVVSAFTGDFVLLVPRNLIHELTSVLKERPYFTQRISPEQTSAYIDALLATGESIDSLPEILPSVVRDVRDDYLIAAALIGRADYLVTGDKDLLSLGDAVEPLVILTPADFATRVLDQRG